MLVGCSGALYLDSKQGKRFLRVDLLVNLVFKGRPLDSTVADRLTAIGLLGVVLCLARGKPPFDLLFPLVGLF